MPVEQSERLAKEAGEAHRERRACSCSSGLGSRVRHVGCTLAIRWRRTAGLRPLVALALGFRAERNQGGVSVSYGNLPASAIF